MKSKYILNYSQLHSGDIILTRQKGAFSCLIRYFLDSEYSHAIFLYRKTAYIHAVTKGGVQTANIQRFIFKDKSDICVIRLKNSIPNRSQIIQNACDQIVKDIASPYSLITAFKNAPLFSNKIPRLFKKILLCLIDRIPRYGKELRYYSYCSQLVARAFGSAGFFSNLNFCTPRDLFENQNFEKIKIDLIDINDLSEWGKYQLKTKDTLKENHTILLNCLKKIRNINSLTKNVYSLGELENVYSSGKMDMELDKKITNILKQKGYFDQAERMRSNPDISYRYGDLIDFRNFIKEKSNSEEQLSILAELRNLANTEIIRFNEQLSQLRTNYSQTNFQFYKECERCYVNMIKVYEKLYDNVINF